MLAFPLVFLGQSFSAAAQLNGLGVAPVATDGSPVAALRPGVFAGLLAARLLDQGSAPSASGSAKALAARLGELDPANRVLFERLTESPEGLAALNYLTQLYALAEPVSLEEEGLGALAGFDWNQPVDEVAPVSVRFTEVDLLAALPAGEGADFQTAIRKLLNQWSSAGPPGGAGAPDGAVADAQAMARFGNDRDGRLLMFLGPDAVPYEASLGGDAGGSPSAALMGRVFLVEPLVGGTGKATPLQELLLARAGKLPEGAGAPTPSAADSGRPGAAVQQLLERLQAGPPQASGAGAWGHAEASVLPGLPVAGGASGEMSRLARMAAGLDRRLLAGAVLAEKLLARGAGAAPTAPPTGVAALAAALQELRHNQVPLGDPQVVRMVQSLGGQLNLTHADFVRLVQSLSPKAAGIVVPFPSLASGLDLGVDGLRGEGLRLNSAAGAISEAAVAAETEAAVLKRIAPPAELRAGVIEQVRAQLEARSFSRADVRRMTLMLHPPELGRVEIAIEAQAGARMVATLVAETAFARETLQQHLGDLRAALVGQGYDSVELEVQLGGSQEDWRSHQRAGEDGGDGFDAEESTELESAELNALEFGQVRAVAQASSGHYLNVVA